jgi:rhodanese-related sulfurtransferase
VPPPGSRSIDDILAAARWRLTRLDPQFAFYILSQPRTPPAVLVDIRPFHQRQEEGAIPGALPIERNVLEWRFDPRSTARLPVASRYDLRVIVFCSEGYTSSLAARSLQELGLWNATDIAGGYKAWKAAGLDGIPQHAQ